MFPGQDLFILFIAPIVGLFFDLTLSKKIIGSILLVCALLFIPIILGYNYTVLYVYQILLVIIGACSYAFFFNWVHPQSFKLVLSFLSTIILFIIFGYGAFADAFAGFEEPQNTWKIAGYKIEYIKSQGFSGGPLMKYELSEYGWISLFIKRVETISVAEDTQSCNIKFDKSQLTFNKCTVEIVKTRHE